MTEFVHLVGAEDVRSAAGSIARSAGEISSAAGSIDSTRHMFFQQLDERLVQFERLVERLEKLSTDNADRKEAAIARLLLAGAGNHPHEGDGH